MVWSKAKRLRLYRLAISSVTQDIQNGSSFLLFKLEPLDRSHEVNRLLRAQRAEGRGYRRSGWGGGSRASSWPQRLYFGPGGLLAGGVFIAITALLKRFALDTTRKSFWVGLLGGIAIWVVVYVPVADLLAPTDLSNLMFAGGSFIFHLVYGVVTALVSLWLIRRSVRAQLTA